MSEAEATKPVEAVQPEAAPRVEEKPVEETTESKNETTTEEKTGEKTSEKPEEKPEEKTEEQPAAQSADQPSKILKTTAQVDYENPRNNRKFDPSTRDVTDDPAAIRKQVAIHRSNPMQ
jgi:lupus La protein